jgi:hypothetical protein
MHFHRHIVIEGVLFSYCLKEHSEVQVQRVRRRFDSWAVFRASGRSFFGKQLDLG